MSGFNWEGALAELKRRREMSRELGGKRRIDRQHEQGRLTIRERIEHAATEFYEVGEYTAFEEHSATGEVVGKIPSSYVCGLAQFGGRTVSLGGEDFTVRAGAPQTYLDRMKGGMGGFVEDLAHELRIPLVLFMEGIGGDIAAQADKGHSYLVSSLSWRRSFELLAEVPVMTMVSGTSAGGTAGRTVLSHFSVMTRDSAMFAGGPPLVKRALGKDLSKSELGGSAVHTGISGGIDNLAEDEADAIAQMQKFLSYMPQNVWELPPRGDRSDPVTRRADELLTIIPENRRRPYKAQKMIEAIVDRESFFEVGGGWGKGIVTGYARMDGTPVGIISSNPMHLGGALDAAAAEKQIRFVDICSTFHLPVIYFVDVPGFMVGPDAERGSVVRWGMRAIQSLVEAEVPVVTIQVRKAYGMAVSATAQTDGLCLRLAWPSAEWGDLPVEGGVEAAYSREIAAAENPEEYRRIVEDKMYALSDPWATVEAFGVENMIDPRETREIVCAFVEASRGLLESKRGPQRRQWTIRP
ncbi:acyl-CoA carboxylase subunit beta [Rhodococcus sp. T7]|uniref:acyl-CoA carboxylase subunit beta n=1 Tax=Rhodococcus sp. T7 TaxID=627444 RepID=UPI001356AEB8|nr:carboxyl transferase domain-containing protein [Rhodococcus sp. T7]KAF0960014.1 Methylmalonyl-CoA carboxyltransferase 12S subunit [Rhodococcus sp. T7]